MLCFPNEEGRFILDMDTSLFAVSGVLNQLQEDREDRLFQPEPPALPTPILYYTTENVGGGGQVHSLLFISEGSAVYTAH